MPQVEIGRILLNQYRVEEFIGGGGAGLVYRVRDLKMNTDLAMKVLNIDADDDPSYAYFFKREAKAYEYLAHPNIVRYYGVKHTDGIYFLLLDYIDGDSLQKILARQNDRRLPISDVLSIFKAISAALGYAHNNGVVHCDIKPGNIMVDQGGKVYLTDFGIARHMESTVTDIGAAGTIAYMSPEQFLKEPLRASTDIYSMGVLLYEMLVGQKPFRPGGTNTGDQSRTARERLQEAHLKQAPPDPCLIRVDLPADVGRVVTKAMQKDPNHRFQTTQEFFTALCAAFGFFEGAISDRIAQQFNYSDPQTPRFPAVASATPLPAKGSAPAWFKMGAVAVAGIVVVILISTLSRTSSGGVTSQTGYSPSSPEAALPISAGVSNSPESVSGQQEFNLPPQATDIPTPMPTPTFTEEKFRCPGMPVSRVKVHDKIVVDTQENLSLRETPSMTGIFIRYLRPKDKAIIIGGPVCADGFTWWEVDVEKYDKRGWVREGRDEELDYFIRVDDAP